MRSVCAASRSQVDDHVGNLAADVAGAGDGEQLPDGAIESAKPLLDAPQVVRLRLVDRAEDSAGDEVEHREARRERRAQVVGHLEHELRPFRHQALDRLVGLGVLDGERDQVGGEAQELAVAVAEAVGGRRVDAERPDHPRLDLERRQHRRAEAERGELALVLLGGIAADAAVHQRLAVEDAPVERALIDPDDGLLDQLARQPVRRHVAQGLAVLRRGA